MARDAVRVVIHGRVQGVGFRWWTVNEARNLGLDGWVRNRRDGTVEAVLAGGRAEIEAMIEKCRQGPALARVTDIQISEADVPAERGFSSRPTV